MFDKYVWTLLDFIALVALVSVAAIVILSILETNYILQAV